jgi:transcriptional regulator with XRE-family HTH domain
MNTAGKNIRTLRQKHGWSQTDVATQLNISIPAFSKIECGITDINLSRLKQIAELFKVHATHIFFEDGESPEMKNLEENRILKEKLSERDEELIILQKKLISLFDEIRDMKKVYSTVIE